MTSESPPPHKKNGQALPVPVRADEGIRTDRPAAGERRAVRAKEADVRIFEEILSALGIAEDVAFGGAKVVLYAGRCAYFENVQSVLSFSAEEVVLRLKRGEVRARGKDLCVARYGGEEFVVFLPEINSAQAYKVADRLRQSIASIVIYSDDNGENWKIGGMISGGNESTVAELEDGRILISCRCSGGKRMLAWSEDGGETFGESVKMASLPDPKCQASLLNTVYEGQYVLLHSNCANASSRIKMTVKASTDGGGTWNAGHIVWDGMTAYSDMVMINENIIGILYENGSSSSYERISFDRVAMSYVLDSDKD